MTSARKQAADVQKPAAPTFAEARDVSWSPVSVVGETAAVEQYRRLAAALIHANAEHGVKVVMIASAVSGEGKTLTAANLAVTLARSYGRRTLVVDADLRSPRLHDVFHVENAQGLNEWLRDGSVEPVATLQLLTGLSLLPAGRPTNDPMAGLASPRMKSLLADASAQFDFVIVDTPPVTLVPDAEFLIGLVDTAVLVIRAKTTPHALVERAVAMLGRERVLGTVLNCADGAAVGRYGYGYPRR
jgi:capsular exopolysaccharide synthesis family protein